MRSGQTRARPGEEGGKIFASEKFIFRLTPVGQLVARDKFGIDEAGMAHDDAALGEPIEKAREQRAEILRGRKIVGAGKSGIEGNVDTPCLSPKTATE